MHAPIVDEEHPNKLVYCEASRQSFLKDTQEIIERLVRRVQRDRDSFDDYLVLGRLYRIRSESDRALRLHRNLLVKSDLTRDQKTRLYIELGDDLLDLKAQDCGVSYYLSALEFQKNHVKALEGLANAYEQLGYFEKSADVLEKLIRLGRPEKKKIAYIYSAIASASLENGLLGKARRLIHKALKADPHCLYAQLILTDIYIQGTKFEKAIQELKKVFVRWPHHSYLALRKMEDCYYRMNQFPLFEETLHDILRFAPDNYYVHYSLARHLRKKKRDQDALAALRRTLELNPYYVNAVKDRIEMAGDGQELKEIKKAANEFFTAFKRSRRFICPNCRHRYSEITWRCVHCGTWDTFEIRYELPAP